MTKEYIVPVTIQRINVEELPIKMKFRSEYEPGTPDFQHRALAYAEALLKTTNLKFQNNKGQNPPGNFEFSDIKYHCIVSDQKAVVS
jgi:hypothetical protein